jgi:hypothetical protein
MHAALTQALRPVGPILILALAAMLWAVAPASGAEDDTYDKDEILAKAEGFFGSTTKGLAEAIEKVFEDQGAPNAYITGEEVSGAIGVGLRYGKGTLNRKNDGSRQIFWQGPSIGWDLGGNVSKVFVLIYHLGDTEEMFQRFPGVEGSFYVVAGLGVNYQQSGDVILAPIRTGVGLRAGANVGYLHYGKKHSWLPF